MRLSSAFSTSVLILVERALKSSRSILSLFSWFFRSRFSLAILSSAWPSCCWAPSESEPKGYFFSPQCGLSLRTACIAPLEYVATRKSCRDFSLASLAFFSDNARYLLCAFSLTSLNCLRISPASHAPAIFNSIASVVRGSRSIKLWMRLFLSFNVS